MITEATVRMAHLYPELVPDTAVVNIVANYEAVPPILDLRRFSPLFLQLKNIAVDRDDQVQLIIKADKTRRATVAGSLTGNPNAALGGAAPSRFDVLGRETLYYNLFSTAIKANFRSYFGVWIYQPTVAHKLKMGVTLTKEEKRISEELGIANTVEKGLLPLPLSQQIEREYQVIDEITHGQVLTVPTTGVVVETLHPLIDEFLVLTKIASDPGTTAQNVRLTIDRDDDANYVSLMPTYPLSLDFDLDCFIPALTEIRLSLIATSATGADFNIRYTVLRCKMTNILRARWELVSKDELPEPTLWDKVKGGIL